LKTYSDRKKRNHRVWIECKEKESTARISMYHEIQIPNIFTMEASFCGADRGTKKDQHFTTEYLMLAGQKLLEALLVYCKIDVSKYVKDKKLDNNNEYTLLNFKEIENELSNNKKLIDMTNGREDGESSGSDS
jgi:hypothetical protein